METFLVRLKFLLQQYILHFKTNFSLVICQSFTFVYAILLTFDFIYLGAFDPITCVHTLYSALSGFTPDTS